MRAIADNPDLARDCPASVRAARCWSPCGCAVGALCALGGVMIGVKSVVMPELGWEFLIPAFAAMILGGIGSPAGAVLGGS